ATGTLIVDQDHELPVRPTWVTPSAVATAIPTRPPYPEPTSRARERSSRRSSSALSAADSARSSGGGFSPAAPLETQPASRPTLRRTGTARDATRESPGDHVFTCGNYTFSNIGPQHSPPAGQGHRLIT